jgi:hypothetical protein
MTDAKDDDVKDDVVATRLKAIEDELNKVKEENVKLKEFADLTIKEKKDKAAKDKAEIERLAQEALNAKANTQEEAENIAKQWREKAEAAERAIKDRDQRDRQRQLQDEALRIAQTKAAKDPNRAKVLADILVRNLKLDDDGKIVVTDDKGNATISPVDELVNKVANDYKFLVDGLDSSGGGIHSSASKPQKKFSEMTTAEKVELYNKDPEEYDKWEAQG